MVHIELAITFRENLMKGISMRTLQITAHLAFGFAALALSKVEVVLCGEVNDNTRRITVTGSATINVSPDEVVIAFGVETRAPDLPAAMKANDERVARVIENAKNLGIESRQVQTDYINVSPHYKSSMYETEGVEPDYYQCRKTIVITLRDITKFETLLSTSVEAGANHIHSVDFGTTQPRKFRDEARAMAIKAAKEKAVDLGKQMDQSIGAPIPIEEDQGNSWQSYSSWWGRRSLGYLSNYSVTLDESPRIEDMNATAPGQISVSASVTVVFELKPATD